MVPQTKTVLVLGASGRVSTLLRQYWQCKPPENINFFWAARRAGPGITHVWTKGDAVDSLPQCDVVLALWGTVSGGAEKLRDNISLAEHAQTIARACGADRVFHASSVAVYLPSTVPIQETGTLAPRNEYGRSKLEMERSLVAAQPAPVLLRLANVVGADSLFSALETQDEISIDQFEDGSGPRRSYLRISTLASLIECLSYMDNKELPNVLNVADSPVLDMAEIALCSERTVATKPAGSDALPIMSVDIKAMLEICGPKIDAVTPSKAIAEWQWLRGEE